MAKDKEQNRQSTPMTYEVRREPNLRYQLAAEARRSEDGTVDVEKVTETGKEK